MEFQGLHLPLSCKPQHRETSTVPSRRKFTLASTRNARERMQGRSQTKYDGGATELQPTCLKANLHAIR